MKDLIIDGKPLSEGDRVWGWYYGWGNVRGINVPAKMVDIDFDGTLVGLNFEAAKRGLYRQEMRLVPADAVVVRPDWEDAPENMVAWAVDANGISGGFRGVPEYKNGFWYRDREFFGAKVCASICDEAEYSLRLRPEPEKKESRWRWAVKFKNLEPKINREIAITAPLTEAEVKSAIAGIEQHGEKCEWYERIDNTKDIKP